MVEVLGCLVGGVARRHLGPGVVEGRVQSAEGGDRVLDHRDLAPAQSRDPARTVHGQPGLLRSDLVTPRPEKSADFTPVVDGAGANRPPT
jgi:hypothetical protein